MTESAEVLDPAPGHAPFAEPDLDMLSAPVDKPSNEVLARVGDAVLRAARDGVRHGVRPEEIIRQIVAEHKVRMSLGDLRLLLASRRKP